ncbi:MAG: efflux RND transporter permease subunit [Verrucomicrobia bacterium]|nr:efflux RND transporter permease subunit [Verrucomicrobiota bacterium]
MWIVRLALRRPYTFVVAALALVLLTPFVLLRTPTDIFPSINIPVVSVIWQYAGLNAQEIEQRILYIHERSLSATVNDIEHIESNSYSGVGIIKIFLREGASVDGAVAQITAVAQTVTRLMPPGQMPPLVIRYSASTVPVLQYSITSTTLSEGEIYDTTLNQIRTALVTVPGAQIPWPYGGKTRVVSVDLDLNALKARGMTPQDVVNAVAAQNLIMPSGTAKVGDIEYDVEVNSSPRVLEELNDLPVRTVGGTVIRLREVGQVRDGSQPQTNVVRHNGTRGVLLTIMKNGMASTLDVVAGIKKQMPKALSTVSPELVVKEFSDQSRFVYAAIQGVLHEGIVAAALTALMILLFIGSWRSTVIIALSIPLAVLSSVAILSALGETINLMTLGGLALAVGILVDDATVEIENVHRQMDMGKPLTQAILDGAEEIAMPALVSTLCICIVFVPMFFLNGVARYLFVPLAEAVVFAMLASYVLSRTIIPTLVQWFYRNQRHEAHGSAALPGGMLRPFFLFQRAFERVFEAFRRGYRTCLSACLQRRVIFSVLFLMLCAGSMLILPFLGRDFFPQVDSGQIRLHLRARSGTRIEETAQLVERVEQAIRKTIPEKDLEGILDNMGIPNSGISLSYSNNGLLGTGDSDVLISLNPGHAPTFEYERQLRARLNREFPGTVFYFLPADIISQTLNFGLPAPLDIQIRGRDQNANRLIAAKIADRIRSIAGIVDVRIQQPADLPRLQINVERERAALMNLSEKDVANSILLSLSGSGQMQPIYWLNPKIGVQYLVNFRAPEAAMDSLESLASIPVTRSTPGEGDVQLLSNLSSVQRTQAPPLLSHYNILPVIDVYAGVAGRDLGSVLSEVRPVLDGFNKDLPRGSFIEIRGQAETMRTSFVALGLGLCGAVVLIYLLLVVNFQSWLDPFVIIMALPGAAAGVAWGLHLTQTPLSVPALMGAIMSLGVATANSVLVISFAREQLAAGLSPVHAALEAGSTRLRAVIMTALAMIIGMVPMALGSGEGGEQNAPLARAVIGGLCLATLATLFFVPAVFALLHRNSRARRELENELLQEPLLIR